MRVRQTEKVKHRQISLNRQQEKYCNLTFLQLLNIIILSPNIFCNICAIHIPVYAPIPISIITVSLEIYFLNHTVANPYHKNLFIILYANNKGTEQRMHLPSLVGTILVYILVHVYVSCLYLGT